MTGLYAIRNSINDKVYIGQAVDTSERWSAHRSALNRGNHHNSHLQHAWNKYGEEVFYFELLMAIDAGQEVDKLEERLIDLTKSRGLCYNVSIYASAPMRGLKQTAETRKKISLSLLGNKRNLGHKAALEAKHKMSEAHKGNKYALGHTHTVSDEERAKRSVRMRGEGNPQWGKPGLRLGKTHTKEARRKMSEGAMGQRRRLGAVLSDGTKEKIRLSLKQYFQENDVPRDTSGRLVKKQDNR